MKSIKNKKVVFMGTPEFSVPILEMLIEKTNVVLVVTQKDAYVGRKHELKYSPIKEISLKNNIEVFQPIKIREDYKRILEVKPDIIITCAYGQIIPSELLDLCEYGAINVHASLLPFLRGGAPIHHSIIDGYKETGITIMYMNEKMDQGDIISQKKIIIEDTDNVGIIHDKLSLLGKELLESTLQSIFDKTNQRITQDETKVTYAYTIKREDEHIDFNLTAEEIHNKIRGLYPFPMSYMILNNEEIKLCLSEIGTLKKGSPGEIIAIYKDGIGIMCKDKEIIIKKLKPCGKKEMDSKEFINGKRKENLMGKKCE